ARPAPTHTPEPGRPARGPADRLERQKLDAAGVAPETDLAGALRALLDSPSLGSKRWLYRQYDQLVQGNTVIGPGGDAALVRIKREDGTATDKAVALSVDCNPRWCWLAPDAGPGAAGAQGAREAGRAGAR